MRESLWQGLKPAQLFETPHSAIRLKDLISKFYSHSNFLSRSPKWKHEAKLKIEKDILPILGNFMIPDITEEVIYKLYLNLKGRGVSNATIFKYHDLLSAIGQTFERINPNQLSFIKQCTSFRKMFPKEPATRDINFLTEEELEKVFNELKKSKNKLLYPYIKFISYSGLRRTEAYQLKWSDVDSTSGFIVVRRSKNGKTRRVPLDPEALKALNLLSRKFDNVFTKPDGGRYHPDSLLRPLQRAAKQAGISKRIDIHSCRHSFGSNKIRNGWGLKKVSILLGHSDITTTAHIYSHMLDGDLKFPDEVFQMPALKTDSNNLIGRSETLRIAEAIVHTLGATDEGLKSLVQLLENFPATFGEIMQEVSTLSKNYPDATPVLHTQDYRSKKQKQSSSNKFKNSSNFGGSEKKPMSGLEPLTYALRKRCSTN